MADPEAISLDDLYTVEALPAIRPDILTVRMLRYQLRHRNDNGLASCVVKLGKRILLSRSRYERWLASRAESGEAIA